MSRDRRAEFAAELTEHGFLRTPFEEPYDREYEIYCPIHEHPATSKKASAAWLLKADKRAFSLGIIRCHAYGNTCVGNGDARRIREEWLARMAVDAPAGDGAKSNKRAFRWKVQQADGSVAWSDGTPVEEADDDNAELIQLYMDELAERPDKVAWLLDERGLTAETVAAYEWGWSEPNECYIYPVYEDGKVHGFKLYDPFHPDLHKKRWQTAEGKRSNQLYGLKQADVGARRIVFEGETDTMLAHQDGFTDAITQTGGAGDWKPHWCKHFKDQVVYFAYDPDGAGIAGRARAAKQLEHFAQAIYYIDIPGGDYSDYRLKLGGTVSAFQALIDHAPEVWRRPQTENELPREGKRLKSVASLKDVQTEGKVVELNAVVMGKVDQPWSLPRAATANCAQNKGEKCKACPLGLADGQKDAEFKPDRDDSLIELMGADSTKTKRILAKSQGFMCNEIEWTATQDWHIEQIAIQNPIGTDSTSLDDSTYSAYHFYSQDSNKAETTTDYRMVGRQVADPRNNQLLFVVWLTERVQSSIEQFQILPATVANLKLFQPDEWTQASIEAALKLKYEDLAANVTGIYHRQDLHQLYDLVMHSAIGFNFQGDPIDKGWLDCIVMGDTRTGKSQVVSRINKHYHAGYMVSGENASYAGLVGGSAEVPGSKRRMAEWGVLPRHNMRAVAIDEASGLDTMLDRMSSIRVSGVAEINKQGGGRADARVRLFWLANPTPNISGVRTTKNIIGYHGGAVRALVNLIGRQEDIARFDMAIKAASEDVPTKQIIAGHTGVDQRYTSDACHDMVMFAWSRRPEHITWDKDAEAFLKRMALLMSAKYTKDIPLVMGSNFKDKLARMCVALAIMTYSVGRDNETVIVRKSHIQVICRFMTDCYDDPLFGYGDVSKQAARRQDQANSSINEVMSYLTGKKTMPGFPNGRDVFIALNSIESGYFERQQLEAMVNGSGTALQWMSQVGMLRSAGGGRHIDFSSELTQILREINNG